MSCGEDITLPNFVAVYERQTTNEQYCAIHISLLLVQEIVESSLLQAKLTFRQSYDMENCSLKFKTLRPELNKVINFSKHVLIAENIK